MAKAKKKSSKAKKPSPKKASTKGKAKAEKKPVKKPSKPSVKGMAGKKPVVKKRLVKEKPVKAKKPKPKKKKGLVKAKIKKTKEVKGLAEQISKKSKPMFRGRFGKRGSVRKISKKKWQKWRKPRGIDINFKREDGKIPKTGFKTPNQIRGRHPSGYFEAIVSNEYDITALSQKKDFAARISSRVGKRKRLEIIKKGNDLGVKILN